MYHAKCIAGQKISIRLLLLQGISHVLLHIFGGLAEPTVTTWRRDDMVVREEKFERKKS